MPTMNVGAILGVDVKTPPRRHPIPLFQDQVAFGPREAYVSMLVALVGEKEAARTIAICDETARAVLDAVAGMPS